MRVFPDLCMQARELGAKRLDFTAQLHDESTPEGICGEWMCWGSEDVDGRQSLGAGFGRTGEEALRDLVRVLGRPR